MEGRQSPGIIQCEAAHAPAWDVAVCAGVWWWLPCGTMDWVTSWNDDSIFSWYFMQSLRKVLRACAEPEEPPCRSPLSQPSCDMGLSVPLTATQTLPIPDDPKKRKTSGCSSSYQPFSFLRIAAFKDNENKKGGGGKAYKSMTQKQV